MDYAIGMPQPVARKTAVFSDDRGKQGHGYASFCIVFPYDSRTILGAIGLALVSSLSLALVSSLIWKPVFCE